MISYSHKVFIVGGGSKGVFENVVHHLDQGAELISTAEGNTQIVYILRKVVSVFRTKGIKGRDGKSIIGFEVTELKPGALKLLVNEFEFEEEAQRYVELKKNEVWDSPIEMKMEVDHADGESSSKSAIVTVDGAAVLVNANWGKLSEIADMRRGAR